MYNFLTKNGQTIAFGLGVVLVAIYFISVNSGLNEFNLLPEEQQSQTSIFNFGLNAAIGLTILSAIAMLVFGIYQIATNVKGSLKGIIGIAVLIIVFIVSYNMSSGTAETEYIADAIKKYETDGRKITEGNLKFIGGSISTALVVITIAAGAFVLSEIRNFFK